MPFKISLHYDKHIKSNKPAAETLAYLKNYTQALPPHFPGIETFKEVAPDTFHWHFKKLKASGQELSLSTATKFEVRGNEIKIVPQPMTGGSLFSGHWKIEDVGTKSTVLFHCFIEVDVPVSSFLKPVLTPVATQFLQKLLDEYATNLENTLR